MPARSRGDVTVLDRHGFPSPFQQNLLVGPDVSDADVESINAAFQRLDEIPQPFLEHFALSSFLASNPVGQLGNDNCACVSLRLFALKPGDHLRVSVAL